MCVDNNFLRGKGGRGRGSEEKKKKIACEICVASVVSSVGIELAICGRVEEA